MDCGQLAGTRVIEAWSMYVHGGRRDNTREGETRPMRQAMIRIVACRVTRASFWPCVCVCVCVCVWRCVCVCDAAKDLFVAWDQNRLDTAIAEKKTVFQSFWSVGVPLEF